MVERYVRIGNTRSQAGDFFVENGGRKRSTCPKTLAPANLLNVKKVTRRLPPRASTVGLLASELGFRQRHSSPSPRQPASHRANICQAPSRPVKEVSRADSREEIVELASPQLGEGVVEAREPVGGFGVERWGIGVKALADTLGKSRDGVSDRVRRAASQRGEDATFAKGLEELDCGFAKSLGQRSMMRTVQELRTWHPSLASR